MKLWIDKDGLEIVAPNVHIPLAVTLLPGSVIAPLQREYERDEFDAKIYEAMFARGYLHASVTDHTVVLQQSNVARQADLPPAQQSWIAAKRLKGFEVKFHGR